MAGSTIKDFKDLDVWRVARELRLDTIAQRTAQLLNGYLRATLALKKVA